LGGTLEEVQAEAATPEAPRPRFDIQRQRERQPSREIERLPEPDQGPGPVLDEPMDEAAVEPKSKRKSKSLT